MNAFLFRLIVAIYVLIGLAAFTLFGGFKGAITLSQTATITFFVGSLVNVPILLIAWVCGAFSRPKQPWNR